MVKRIKKAAYEVVVTHIGSEVVADSIATAIRNAQGGERLFKKGIAVEVRKIEVSYEDWAEMVRLALPSLPDDLEDDDGTDT